jgi:hypothetical protein
MKRYELTLCKGEPEEEVVFARLTNKEVDLIKEDIAGCLFCLNYISTEDGKMIETGIIDDIKEYPTEEEPNCTIKVREA